MTIKELENELSKVQDALKHAPSIELLTLEIELLKSLVYALKNERKAA